MARLPDALTPGTASSTGFDVKAFKLLLPFLWPRDVIGGAGAFVMIADEENSCAEAVLRKLLLEIAGAGPTDAIQAAHAPAGAVTLAGDVSVAR